MDVTNLLLVSITSSSTEITRNSYPAPRVFLLMTITKIITMAITRHNCTTVTYEMQETSNFVLKIVKNLLQSCLRPVNSSEFG